MDKKISDLTVATAIDQNDISILVHNDADYQFSFALMLQFLAGNLSVGATINFGSVNPQNTTGANGDVFINVISGQFLQRTSGTWSVKYTVPAGGSADGTVLYGTGAPVSGNGKNLDTYIDTTTGTFYLKSNSAWAQVFTMLDGPAGVKGDAGTDGIDGTNGNTVLHGIVTPSNTTDGVNGDIYLKTTTYELFGPKTAGVWGAGTSLFGPGFPNGGTTGQILKKASNDDGDTVWVNEVDISGKADKSYVDSQDSDLQTEIDGKVDKVTGKQLTDENYSSAEKTKLSNLSEHYVGYYSSLSALQSAHPTGLAGQYATVDLGSGNDAKQYIWDNNDNNWILGSGSAGVTSVNSQTGAVSLSTDDIGEGSNPARIYFTAARVLAVILSGISFSTVSAVLATDSILIGVGKLQAQITDLYDKILPTGGSAGQVLSKVNSTNYNVQWITPASIPTVSSGEKAVTQQSDGTHVDYDVTELVLSDIDDSAGDKTSSDLETAYSDAVIGNWVWGVNNLYIKKSAGTWHKIPATAA